MSERQKVMTKIAHIKDYILDIKRELISAEDELRDLENFITRMPDIYDPYGDYKW